ncbi:minor capsid protein [Halalkalibacterium halodurans]|uniref:minor capsid protein n=1 Tax=Halalkalibacterium halodurans TaxID=86665 RepID=UPI002E1BA749|nr:minor capsid protein [Halalkalibacterium halodurans]MED4084933.1 minor capsid protein [Halalkalibacterium halodurans]MED4104900.1 minor capsid protein [Halalkalibacterium halodurans]MED4110439.1 minor capsid protein [Halalkalibacterium halodurans]MED4123049.1 minor capsid protein [Halalkalibacterium halodurans]
MVQVNINLQLPKQKLSQGNIKRGRYALSNQALSDTEQFVPMKEGSLRITGHMNGDGTELIWNTPYAARLFYVPMFNYTTPGTGPRWDMKAKRMFMSDWINAFVKGADW